MQKWHIHLITGRGRPVNICLSSTYNPLPSRQDFHTSSPHPQHAGQGQVMQEAANSLPNRAKRLHESTKEVENLYYQHAAKDNSIASPFNTTFQSISSGGGRRIHPASSNGQDERVPFSREVLEGELPHSRDHGRLQYNRSISGVHRDGVVNATALAARPQRRPGESPFTMGRTDPIDARSLGARPQNPESDRDIRRSGVYTSGPRKDTIGLEQKQRFPPRQTSQYLQGERQRRGPASVGDRYQGALSRGNGGHGDNSRLDSRMMNREGRIPDRSSKFDSQDRRPERGNFASRSSITADRPRRARTSRNDEGGEPRRRKRDRQAANSGESGNSKQAEPIWNEEEEEYIKEKQKRAAAQALDHVPENLSEDAFSGIRPAVISGERGMSEVLGERLIMAKRHLEGEYVEWASKERKAEVMTLVERLKGINEEVPKKLESGGSPSPTAEVEIQTHTLLQKLLGGKYEFTEPQQGKDILGHVARHTDRNESYFPDDQRSLLEKVKSLMPQDHGRRGGRSAKPEAKK